MAGRKSKLTKQTRETICGAIREGATYKDASNIAGVSYSTFNEWMFLGRKAEKRDKYLQFLEAVEEANAAVRTEMAAVIRREAVGGDWRAAESFLKRRDPYNC